MGKKNFFTTFRRLVVLVCRTDRKYLIVLTGTILILSIMPAISLVIMQKIINLLQLKNVEIKIILLLIAIYIFADIVAMLLQAFLNYYKMKFSCQFGLDLKEQILKKAAYLELKDFENNETYNLLQRAEQQTDGGIIAYFDTLCSIVSSLVAGITYAALLISFKPWIIPILFIIPGLSFFLNSKVNKEEYYMMKKRTDKERKAWYNSYIITCGMNYKELRLYELFDHFIKCFRELKAEFNLKDCFILKKRLQIGTILGILEQFIIGILFSYIVFCGFREQILIGDIVTFTRSMSAVRSQVQILNQKTSELKKQELFLNQLFLFLDMKEKEKRGNIKITKIESIEIRNLSYRYQNQGKNILDNVNLYITKGDYIAIVGRNGSGKSTLMKILLGFYEEYEGEILVNGINLREIDLDSYMAHIGALFQDFTKYEGTIRENMCYSNMKKWNDDSAIKYLGQKFGLAELVLGDAARLDSHLGYWFDSSKQISFGQWQKIGLTRTFMRNADMYFLDEPNAALDAISEMQIAELYKSLFEHKIGILIAHKFNSFIQSANKIVVLKEGKIEACGEHLELMENSEEYRELYNMQMIDF